MGGTWLSRQESAQWVGLSRAGGVAPPTFLVEWQLVELEAAGLHAHIAVHMLSAGLVHCHGILQRLHTGLQAERHLSVPHRVPPWEGGERGVSVPPWSIFTVCKGVRIGTALCRWSGAAVGHCIGVTIASRSAGENTVQTGPWQQLKNTKIIVFQRKRRYQENRYYFILGNTAREHTLNYDYKKKSESGSFGLAVNALKPKALVIQSKEDYIK